VVWEGVPADALSTCSGCGAQGPRSEMFGVEPALFCERCAAGIRQRTFVRHRPRIRDTAPVATAVMLALAGALFVPTNLLYPGPRQPAWIEALYVWRPIWEGEFWRHLTSMFLHHGWVHMLFNGFALWSLGRAVEFGFGRFAVVGVTLGAGVVGSIAQWGFDEARLVGLSGGIFGLAGFLFPLRKSHPVAAMVMTRRTINWLVTWFVICIVLTETGRLNIGNWAHGGGLAFGLLVGYAAGDRRRRVWMPLLSVLTLALLVGSPHVAFAAQRTNRAYYLWLRDLEPLQAEEATWIRRAQAIHEALGGDEAALAQSAEYREALDRLADVRKRFQKAIENAPRPPRAFLTPIRRSEPEAPDDQE